MSKTNGIDAAWLRRIAESLSGIKYGSVHITIHDGKIVQIERTEKRRFDNPARPTGGEGHFEK